MPAAGPALVHPVGVVRSALARRADAPRQGDEGAPDATIVLEPSYADALEGIQVGDELVLLTICTRRTARSCRFTLATTRRVP